MDKCIIFCAGGFDGLIAPIDPEDHILAADGGYRHTRQLGLVPHGILGDFDSLGYVPQNANVFPVEKDDTDAMLAVRRGLELGYKKFLLYGGLEGSRLDHTVANFQTLQFLADRGAAGYLIGKEQVVTVIKNSSLSFLPGAEGTLSVFCMGEDAEGVSIKGVKYPLADGRLTAGFPLGVSNRLQGSSAEVSVKQGSLLVMFPRSACGLCPQLLSR